MDFPRLRAGGILSAVVPHSFSEFLFLVSEHVLSKNASFLCTQNNLCFLPVYELNEHHGERKSSKWRLRSKSSPGDQLSVRCIVH